MAHVFTTSIREAEVGGPREFQSRLGYKIRSSQHMRVHTCTRAHSHTIHTHTHTTGEEKETKRQRNRDRGRETETKKEGKTEAQAEEIRLSFQKIFSITIHWEVDIEAII